MSRLFFSSILYSYLDVGDCMLVLDSLMLKIPRTMLGVMYISMEAYTIAKDRWGINELLLCLGVGRTPMIHGKSSHDTVYGI